MTISFTGFMKIIFFLLPLKKLFCKHFKLIFEYIYFNFFEHEKKNLHTPVCVILPTGI